MWKVYRTDEFKEWFDNLNVEAKEPILKDILILSNYGPERDIILLVGGNKSNDKNFYSKIISKAEKLFLKHIDDIQRIKDEDK